MFFSNFFSLLPRRFARLVLRFDNASILHSMHTGMEATRIHLHRQCLVELHTKQRNRYAICRLGLTEQIVPQRLSSATASVLPNMYSVSIVRHLLCRYMLKQNCGIFCCTAWALFVPNVCGDFARCACGKFRRTAIFLRFFSRKCGITALRCGRHNLKGRRSIFDRIFRNSLSRFEQQACYHCN